MRRFWGRGGGRGGFHCQGDFAMSAQLGPFSAKLWPTWAKFGRFGPKLPKVWPCSTYNGRTWPTSRRCRQSFTTILAEFGHSLANIGPHLAKSRPSAVEIHRAVEIHHQILLKSSRLGPDLTRLRTNLVDVDQMLVELGRHQPSFGQIRRVLVEIHHVCRMRPESTKIGPNQPTLVEF